MARLLLAAALLVSGARFGQASAETLNIDDFRLSFEENFSDLNVSPYGPGTKWIAHPPWGADLGAAQFADPAPGFPFNRVDGAFRIELRRTAEGRRTSGLLATKDREGHGFAQQ